MLSSTKLSRFYHHITFPEK